MNAAARARGKICHGLVGRRDPSPPLHVPRPAYARVPRPMSRLCARPTSRVPCPTSQPCARHATCDARATFDASTRKVAAGATRGRHSTLRRAKWRLVRRAARDVRRAGDIRRFDARREEQPISKSNILSEHGGITGRGIARFSRPCHPPKNGDFAAKSKKIAKN